MPAPVSTPLRTALPHRSDSAVRLAVTEQVAPLVRFDAGLAARWTVRVDPGEARARIARGRVAYDAAEVVAGAGPLVVPYVRATAALERAGLATDEEAASARERRVYLPGLIRAWLAAEPMPRERERAVARRAAGMVASSILRGASAVVARDGPLPAWERSICPCCGSAPDFSLRTADGRTLLCARCDTRWTTAARGCLGCGEREPPVVARVQSDAIGYSLAICHACGRYVKEPQGDAPLVPLVERVLTYQLDAAAEARGLRL
jgi:hypothetical protein